VKEQEIENKVEARVQWGLIMSRADKNVDDTKKIKKLFNAGSLNKTGKYLTLIIFVRQSYSEAVACFHLSRQSPTRERDRR